MPRMDGIQVLQKIRAGGSSVPVLLLTAKAEVDDKVLGLDSGANDYLTKPFATKELLARIRAMTRTSAAVHNNCLGILDSDKDQRRFLPLTVLVLNSSQDFWRAHFGSE